MQVDAFKCGAGRLLRDPRSQKGIGQMTSTENARSRRQILIGMGGGVAASIAAPFISRRALASTKQLVVSSWGGGLQTALRKAYFAPFQAETGVEIVERTYGSNGLAQLRAEIQAGGATTDLFDGPPFWVSIGRKAGIIGRISYSDFRDRDAHIPEALNEFGYGYGSVSWGIGYNTKSFPNGGPSNWADVWDTAKFKGVRAMFGPIAARHLEYALMAEGVPPGAVNPLNAEKEDRAFAKLKQIKPSVGLWFDSFSQAETMLTSREIDVCEYVSGRAFEAQDKGSPIAFTFKGAVMNLLTWVMAKDAPNKENALKFLAFSSRPDRQAALAQSIFYGPTNTKAFAEVPDEKTRRRLSTHPDNLKTQVLLDGEYWADALGRLKPRWTQITSN